MFDSAFRDLICPIEQMDSNKKIKKNTLVPHLNLIQLAINENTINFHSILCQHTFDSSKFYRSKYMAASLAPYPNHFSLQIQQIILRKKAIYIYRCSVVLINLHTMALF